MPKAVAFHDIEPCPNCGHVSKQPRHQQRHLAICKLLPKVEDVAEEIQATSLAEVSRKYTVPEQAVTETFLRRLMQMNGFPTVSGGEVEDIGWGSDWKREGRLCAACGILTATTADQIPEQVALAHKLLVSHPIEHPEDIIEDGLAIGWIIKLPTTADVLCHMCYIERGEP
jgi:hypothetical protein